MARLLAAGLSLVLLAGTSPAAPAIPEEPSGICPLLIGESIPSAQVRTVAGEPVDLAEAVRGAPTLLVFYRGGW